MIERTGVIHRQELLQPGRQSATVGSRTVFVGREVSGNTGLQFGVRINSSGSGPPLLEFPHVTVE